VGEPGARGELIELYVVRARRLHGARVRVFGAPLALHRRMQSDEMLMTSYAGGEQACFRELYRRWAPRLRASLARRGMTAAEAEDLTQQTFLQLHRHRATFPIGCRFRPWLYTIAMNLMRDQLRRGATCASHADLEAVAGEAPSVADEIDARRALIRVVRALRELTPEMREALELTWAGAEAVRDATARRGLSSSTVRVRAHRAQHALRRLAGLA
jgi:RNA polymerase sigma-70 factor (ECF subfamily)